MEEYPDNGRHPRFVSTVETNGKVVGKGTGPSKKEAQQNAAREALKKLDVSLSS